MTLAEIKAAVAASRSVHWSNELYVVKRWADRQGGDMGLFITCTSNQHSVGLHVPTYFPNGPETDNPDFFSAP